MLSTSSTWWIFQISISHLSPVSRTGINSLFLSAKKSCIWVFVFSWLWTNIDLKEWWKALTQRQGIHFNLVVICGHLMASSNAFHADALTRVTVLHEPSHWPTAQNQQDVSEINLLCAGQGEGKMVVYHLKWTRATRDKSGTNMAQPTGKMLKVAPMCLLKVSGD